MRTPDWKLGIGAGADFGLGGADGDNRHDDVTVGVTYECVDE
jgi:hypothetical protein